MVKHPQILTLAEINHAALQILYKELGVANTIRFMNQFTTGQGNYTLERDELLRDWTLEDVFEELEARKKRKT